MIAGDMETRLRADIAQLERFNREVRTLTDRAMNGVRDSVIKTIDSLVSQVGKASAGLGTLGADASKNLGSTAAAAMTQMSKSAAAAKTALANTVKELKPITDAIKAATEPPGGAKAGAAGAKKDEPALKKPELAPGAKTAQASAAAIKDAVKPEVPKTDAAQDKTKEEAVKAAAEIDKLLDPSKAMTFADAFKSAFGSAGGSVVKLGEAIKGMTDKQNENAKARSTALVAYGSDATKLASVMHELSNKEARDKVAALGDMAGASKSFFKTNSTGYKTLEAAEKGFRKVEKLMAVEAALTKSGLMSSFTGLFVSSKATETAAEAGASAKSVVAAGTQSSAWGVTAVVKALASMPYPSSLVAGAATLAAVVALGVVVGGGINRGAGGKSAETMQKSQGTGTVFGDKGAKSDSIEKSLELLESHSESLVPLNRGMLVALRSIDASMGGLGNLIVRRSEVVNGTNLGIPTGSRFNSQALVDSNKFFGGHGVMGSIMGKISSAIFGKTTTSIVDSGIRFGGSVNALQEGKGYEQYATVDIKKKNLLGSKTRSEDRSGELNKELSQQFAMIFTDVETALTDAAIGLGVGGKHVKDTLDGFNIASTSLSLKGLSGTALAEALNAVLSKTMDQMSAKVFPEMEKFRQVGEGYTETVVRIATNYAALDAGLASIGMTFGATGLKSLAAREQLISLVGGIDRLSEQTSGFADNFLSEAERLAPVQKHVKEELKRLGFASVQTREDFKNAVQGFSKDGKLTDKTGAETYAGLLALQEAFATVVPAIEGTGSAARTAADVLAERNSLQDQYDNVTMSDKDLLRKQRKAIDPSNQPMFDKVQIETTNKGYLDQIKALEFAAMSASDQRKEEIKGMDASTLALYERKEKLLLDAKATADADALLIKNRSIELQIMELTGDKAGVLAANRAAEVVGLNASTVALISNRNALQDQAAAASRAVGGANTAFGTLKTAVETEKTRLQTAYQTEVTRITNEATNAKTAIGEITQRADTVRAVFEKLNTALASTVIESRFFDAAQRRSAQELLARAAITTRGGGTADIKGLDEALATISKPSQQLFGSFEEWARDQARTGSSIAALQANAQAEVDYAALAVAGINKTIEAINGGSEAQLALLATQHTENIARQDEILIKAQGELDLALGVNTGLVSIAEALTQFAAALGVVRDTPAPLSVEGLYQKVLGRQGEKAGLDFWKAAYGDSVNATEEADFIRAAQPEIDAGKNGTLKEFLRKHGVPAYANGGDFAGGLRLVGEHGPELEATGPARIFNAGQTRSLLANANSAGGGDLAGEIRELRMVVQSQAAALIEISSNTGKTAGSSDQLAKQFNNVSSGGNNLRTKAIA